MSDGAREGDADVDFVVRPDLGPVVIHERCPDALPVVGHPSAVGDAPRRESA